MTDSKATTVDGMREELRTDCARTAIDALVQVCRDPKSSSQARATAATTILRAAGFLERDESAGADDKPLSELTAEELQERIERARRKREALERQMAGEDEEPDVFG